MPAGFRYRLDDPALSDPTAPTKRVVEQSARFSGARRLVERTRLRVLAHGGYVHTVSAPAADGAALIHSCEFLLRDVRVPYVVDFEHAELFVSYQRVALKRPWARSRLLSALSDPNLRWLLPWSEAARTSLFMTVGAAAEALQDRTRVVYPAIRPAVARPRRRSEGPLRVLFIGTVFFEKGGVEAIRAVQELAKSHPVHLDLVSYAPDEVRRDFADANWITLHRPAGADLVQRLYASADVLLFPSHMDTFGYVVLEAMAHGVPVLAPRHLALTELIDDGSSGLLFSAENMLYGDDTACRFDTTLPPPGRFLDALRRPSDRYVDGIASSLARVADDRELHSELAGGALASVTAGRFAMDRRREALAEIYADAVR